MKEIIIIGSYHANDAIIRFVQEAQQEFKIIIRYNIDQDFQNYIIFCYCGNHFFFKLLNNFME